MTSAAMSLCAQRRGQGVLTSRSCIAHDGGVHGECLRRAMDAHRVQTFVVDALIAAAPRKACGSLRCASSAFERPARRENLAGSGRVFRFALQQRDFARR